MSDTAIVQVDLGGREDRVSFRIPREQLHAIEQLAREHDRTLSGELRQAVRVYLVMIKHRSRHA